MMSRQQSRAGSHGWSVVLAGGFIAGGIFGVWASPAAAFEPVDFSRDVLPVLAGKCFSCHGPDAEQRAADLRLDQREAATERAIVPGDSAASELVVRITSSNDDLRMPPPEAQHQLTDSDVALLTRWIDEGAASFSSGRFPGTFSLSQRRSS